MIDFIKFCKNNASKILDSIEQTTKTLPNEIKDADHRFQLGHLYSLGLSEDIPELKPYYEIGYDLKYNNTYISCKTQQTIFQRMCKNKTKPTCPKNIALKNCLGDNKNLPEFDYLLAIQRGDNNLSTTTIGFGIIHKSKILHINNSGDQIKIKVYNNEFEIFGIKKITIDPTQKCLDFSKKYYEYLKSIRHPIP